MIKLRNKKEIKKVLESEFTFFKAGQGAFYGGSIYDPQNLDCWTIVYDCGSSSFVKGNFESLKNEIDFFNSYPLNYHQSLGKKIIDILFISHLDYDHVSGVLKLINDFEVKKIVLPYFPIEVRKFVLFSITDVEDPIFQVDDYITFIENPYLFLSVRTKKKSDIFIVFSNEAEYLNENTENRDDGIAEVGITFDPDVPELTGTDKIRKYKNNLQFFLANRWEFTCFYMEIDNQILLDLKKCLSKLLLDKEMTFENIKTLFKDDDTRKKARSCYKKHLSDINSHGLILIHGPLNYISIDVKYQITDFLGISPNSQFCCDYFTGHCPPSKISPPFWGTLLMGDSSFKATNNQIDIFSKLAQKLKRVHVFQLPHHGSTKNWDYNAYKKIIKGFWRPYHPINVCNFGYGNTYGHPSPQVLSDLKGKVVMNSQFLRFTIRYCINYR